MRQKKSILVRSAPVWLLLLVTVMPVWSQEDTDSGGATGQALPEAVKEAAYIGMKLDELIVRYGPPRSVYASRGLELWQDDVVFVYGEGDFYIFRDRVWQAGLRSACGVSVGDFKPAVVLTLGGEAADEGDYILFPLPPAGWPLMLRVNFNAAGRVAAIYIYRPDF
jgi:hypothetical protein